MNLNDIKWCCAYRKIGSNKGYTIIPNPWWGWAADPFIGEEKGKVYIFAELWNNFLQKGSIAVCEVEENRIGKWKVIISEWYHLSYPFIWKDNEGFHICPESSRINRTYRYDCIDFPNRWKKGREYNNGLKLADTTFLFGENNNIVKAFSFLIDKEGGQLISLDTTWNGSYDVISNDLHNARMAGSIILNGRKYYRLAQMCDESYGKGICVNEIKSLEPYSEEKIKELYFGDILCRSKNHIIGMHTYNQSKKYEVIDMRYHKFNLVNFFSYSIIKILLYILQLFRKNIRP